MKMIIENMPKKYSQLINKLKFSHNYCLLNID